MQVTKKRALPGELAAQGPKAEQAKVPAQAGVAPAASEQLVDAFVEDPVPMPCDVDQVDYQSVDGALFVDGASISDVRQGMTGTCFLLSALAGMAKAKPDSIKDLIHDNGDGTYTVRFFDKKDPPRQVVITVDNDLPVQRDGSTRYAQVGKEHELWVALIEKAYVAWQGGANGYGAFKIGGEPTDALFALTGIPWEEKAIGPKQSEEVVAAVRKMTEAGLPCVMGTSQFPADNLMPSHVYTVLGVEERDGSPWIRFRDPRGINIVNNGRADQSFAMPVYELRNFVAYFVPADGHLG
jgi:hypothetical protein